MTIVSRESVARWGLALVCAATLLGCGRSEYERRLNATVQVLRTGGAKFPVPGTPLQLSMPRPNNDPFTLYIESSAEPGTNEPVKPERLQPPFVKLPGFRCCFEMKRPDDGGGQLTYYCYMAATPAGELGSDGKPMEESIGAQAAAALNAQAVTDTVSCPAADGTSATWQRVTVTAPQSFLGVAGAPPVTIPAVFQLYGHEIDGWRLIIVWRVPEKISKEILDMVPGMAGSVAVAPPAAEPAAGAPAN